MQATETRLQLLDTVVSDAVRSGLAQRITEDEILNGRTIRLGGRDLVNFASCSYLGLETDPRLRSGTVDAVLRYGTQFSSSRVYISAPPYRELERLLHDIFESPVIATPSTTLGHLCAIPTLVDERDAVILDHQVHQSVQTATTQVAAAGAHVELVRHSRMDLLEERIRALASRSRHVWYMADGVYSMYGDLAPFSELTRLLDRYETFHLYVDDAHGMSWSGRNGRGVTLGKMDLRPRMVMASSLNKSFAAAGGVLVFADEETRRRVRTCGGPLLFSGPIQPPMLGAANASARIHLSSEIERLQARLRERVALCHSLLESRDLPVLSTGDSPVNFVGVGLTRIAQNLTARLMDEGFYTNVGQFPAVPMKRAGVRFTITLHQTEDDIRALVDAIDHHFPRALEEEGDSVEGAWKAFGHGPARERTGPTEQEPLGSLHVEESTSIASVPREAWDPYLGGRGAFDSEGLGFLERCFSGERTRPEDRWRFHYYRVLDSGGHTRLATFFTEALWKADMLAPEAVSRELEERRKDDPYHLTIRTLSMGSLLTEGDHLFVNRTSAQWKEAVSILLATISEEADRCGAEMIALRDLPADDPEMERFLRDHGYARMPSPARMVVDLNWRDDEEFLASLSRRARYHQRRDVFPWNDAYDIELLGRGKEPVDPDCVEHLYGLYLNVKAQNLELNTFELPKDVFARMLEDSCWELALFRLRPEKGGTPGALPVGFVATFIGADHTAPTVIGLDYRYVRSHGLYRQSLRHMLLRAQELGKRRVCLGMGANFEKRRFGAREIPGALYVQAKDHYAFDVVAQMSANGSR